MISGPVFRLRPLKTPMPDPWPWLPVSRENSMQKGLQSIPAALLLSRIAHERIRTSTGYNSHQALNLARLPIPPRAPIQVEALKRWTRPRPNGGQDNTTLHDVNHQSGRIRSCRLCRPCWLCRDSARQSGLWTFVPIPCQRSKEGLRRFGPRRFVDCTPDRRGYPVAFPRAGTPGRIRTKRSDPLVNLSPAMSPQLNKLFKRIVQR